MKQLRGVKGVIKGNDDVRQKLDAKPVIKTIKQLRWFEHLIRMNKKLSARSIQEAKVKKQEKKPTKKNLAKQKRY